MTVELVYMGSKICPSKEGGIFHLMVFKDRLGHSYKHYAVPTLPNFNYWNDIMKYGNGTVVKATIWKKNLLNGRMIPIILQKGNNGNKS